MDITDRVPPLPTGPETAPGTTLRRTAGWILLGTVAVIFGLAVWFAWWFIVAWHEGVIEGVLSGLFVTLFGLPALIAGIGLLRGGARGAVVGSVVSFVYCAWAIVVFFVSEASGDALAAALMVAVALVHGCAGIASLKSRHARDEPLPSDAG